MRCRMRCEYEFYGNFGTTSSGNALLLRHIGESPEDIIMDIAMASGPPAEFLRKRLNLFERYLTIWVALCMIVGVLLGKSVPGVVRWLRGWEFGEGSHVNAAIAVLIWFMIIPMMMKVDLASIRNVGKRPTGLLVTLFVNWIVKPFSMAFFAWVFFRLVFSAWIAPSEADQYCGTIIWLRRRRRHGVRLELSMMVIPPHTCPSLHERFDYAGALCPDRRILGHWCFGVDGPTSGLALFRLGFHRHSTHHRGSLAALVHCTTGQSPV